MDYTCKTCGHTFFNLAESEISVQCAWSKLDVQCLIKLEPPTPEGLLFYDVETTGLIDYRADKMAPHQPRVTQLAAILTNPEGAIVESYSTYIKPDGWVIPEHVVKITGTTTEICEKQGVPMIEALKKFNQMQVKAAYRLAYNNSYDEFLMDRESQIYLRRGIDPWLKPIDIMALAKEFCKLPATEKMVKAGYGADYKPPKLIEAYETIFGKAFDNAHDALADVKASIQVYFELMKVRNEI